MSEVTVRTRTPAATRPAGPQPGPVHSARAPERAAGEVASDYRLDTLASDCLTQVVLVRIAAAGAKGVTRAGVRRDLEPLADGGGDWSAALDRILLGLIQDDLVKNRRLRLVAAPAGGRKAAAFLGAPLPPHADWHYVRDTLLVGRALALPATQSRMRAAELDSADGLRGAILERAFALGKARAPVPVPSPSRLRDRLAAKVGRGAKPAAQSAPTEQPAQATRSRTERNRRLVERLLRRPRAFGSDGALIAELAAEQVGARETSPGALRMALLRKLVGRPGKEKARAVSVTAAATVADLPAFARAVTAIAADKAEGRAGHRRAYIADVWAAFAARFGAGAGDAAAFKARLVEAHKAGLLTLAWADLRTKETAARLDASAVRTQDTEWHFVRVED